jgi:hypothetical protein
MVLDVGSIPRKYFPLDASLIAKYQWKYCFALLWVNAYPIVDRPLPKETLDLMHPEKKTAIA